VTAREIFLGAAGAEQEADAATETHNVEAATSAPLLLVASPAQVAWLPSLQPARRYREIFPMCQKPSSRVWVQSKRPPDAPGVKLPNGRLREFCLVVWNEFKERSEISLNDVYKIYGRVSNKNVLSGVNIRMIWEFFEKTLEIKYRCDTKNTCHIFAQNFPDFKYKELIDFLLKCTYAPDTYCLSQQMYEYVRPVYLRDIGYQASVFHETHEFQRSINNLAIQDTFIELMMTGFYHFIQNIRIATDWRFYLNVKPQHILDVFEMAVREFLIAMPNDVDSVKLAAPFSPLHGHRETKGRSDTIVIYLRLGNARNRILSQLRQFQREHKDYFNDEVPEMTKPYLGLVGVSEGGEPRQNVNVGLGLDASDEIVAGRRTAAGEKIVIGRSSFGSLRCQLIAEAFNRCHHDQDLFLKLVASHFSNARIDVNLPYL
jgi:hypothetical protein